MADLSLKNPYQAVTVVAGPKACEDARGLEGQSFLAREAPLLPLRACTSPIDCHCRYQKWDDRRQEDRRMIDNGIGSQFRAVEEKRVKGPGRRSED